MKETPMNEAPERMPKNGSAMLWIAIVAIVIVVGIVYFSRGRNQATSPTTNSPSPSANTSPAATAPSANAPAVKAFDISAKPFEFSMKEIRVKKGDRVKINLTVAQGMHDWVVDEFGARTKITQTGQTDSVEFIADKTGTFEYYCSVPTHRQQGMVGKLIVE